MSYYYYDDIIQFYTVLKHSDRLPAGIVHYELNGSKKRVKCIYVMDTSRGIVKPRYWDSWNDEFEDVRIDCVERGTYYFYSISEVNAEHDESIPYSIPRHEFPRRITDDDWRTADYGGDNYLIGQLEYGGYVVIVRD